VPPNFPFAGREACEGRQGENISDRGGLIIIIIFFFAALLRDRATRHDVGLSRCSFYATGPVRAARAPHTSLTKHGITSLSSIHLSLYFINLEKSQRPRCHHTVETRGRHLV
jgi:hypothetical protein